MIKVVLSYVFLLSNILSVPTESRFPEPADSLAEGLVAMGGLLEPDWLLDAYRHGIFPWPMSLDDSEEKATSANSNSIEPMLWWSPDPRAIMPLDGMRISKSLRKTIRSNRFEVKHNTAFAEVLIGCSEGPGREEGTWITPEMQSAYNTMHELGHAHCVEAWYEGRLVGGVYGLAIGGLFAAESMFHYENDASKVALAHLVTHLRLRGYQLMDVQQWTDHTGRLGVIEISRETYLERLQAVIDLPIEFGEELATLGYEW